MASRSKENQKVSSRLETEDVMNTDLFGNADADVVIVNTCAFIEDAKTESIQVFPFRASSFGDIFMLKLWICFPRLFWKPLI